MATARDSLHQIKPERSKSGKCQNTPRIAAEKAVRSWSRGEVSSGPRFESQSRTVWNASSVAERRFKYGPREIQEIIVHMRFNILLGFYWQSGYNVSQSKLFCWTILVPHRAVDKCTAQIFWAAIAAVLHVVLARYIRKTLEISSIIILKWRWGDEQYANIVVKLFSESVTRSKCTRSKLLNVENYWSHVLRCFSCWTSKLWLYVSQISWQLTFRLKAILTANNKITISDALKDHPTHTHTRTEITRKTWVDCGIQINRYC